VIQSLNQVTLLI